ncbi:MAG: TPM domain-containing protein [Ruminococcus sp.]|nr:TPM domain-containing protein [Ruminococcus sp.]
MKVLKKIFAVAAAAFTMLMPVSFSASAELINPELPRVIDNAELFSDSEEQALNDKINEIISAYDFDVVILTEESIGGESPMNYADDYYDYEGYGANGNGDGVLFLINMDERDWWISTKGYGITVFTDYGIEKIEEIVVPELSGGFYFDAFELFLQTTEEYIKAANSGEPYDVDNKYMTTDDKFKSILISVGVGLGIGLVVALIVVLVFKSQLKSVEFEYAAREYEVKNSFNVTRSNDIFLFRNVTKRKKPENNGGGSSTHISSSGSSHGGGGGKF